LQFLYHNGGGGLVGVINVVITVDYLVSTSRWQKNKLCVKKHSADKVG
jgi:hypothetical protein